MHARIGIDGGGTKTEFILTDESGLILARRTAAGCSPSLTARPNIERLITENLRALLAPAGNPTVTHTVLCMAGSRIFWREFATTLTGFGRVQAFDDSIPVLELATGGQPGLVLHAGTGSFVAARGEDGSTHYAGGLGWRFGDAGSAHDIGRRAASRAIMELQGWALKSSVGTAICDALELRESNALTRHFYAPETPQNTMAELAPLVTRLAQADDPVAVEILSASISDLARLAQTVSHQLFGRRPTAPLPVGLSGAILHAVTARVVTTAILGPKHELRLITEPPIEGVRRLLARL